MGLYARAVTRRSGVGLREIGRTRRDGGAFFLLLSLVPTTGLLHLVISCRTTRLGSLFYKGILALGSRSVTRRRV